MLFRVCKSVRVCVRLEGAWARNHRIALMKLTLHASTSTSRIKLHCPAMHRSSPHSHMVSRWRLQQPSKDDLVGDAGNRRWEGKGEHSARLRPTFGLNNTTQSA